jgi:hypothetical protein
MIDSPKPQKESFMLEESALIKQYEKYTTFLERFFPGEATKNLIEHFGERLVLCPAGLTIEEGGYPGALVDRALRTAQRAKQIAQAAELPTNPSSAVRVALVAELGRLGDLEPEAELYLPQTSDWHREKLGQNYKYNDGHVQLFCGFLQWCNSNDKGLPTGRDLQSSCEHHGDKYS